MSYASPPLVCVGAYVHMCVWRGGECGAHLMDYVFLSLLWLRDPASTVFISESTSSSPPGLLVCTAASLSKQHFFFHWIACSRHHTHGGGGKGRRAEPSWKAWCNRGFLWQCCLGPAAQGLLCLKRPASCPPCPSEAQFSRFNVKKQFYSLPSSRVYLFTTAAPPLCFLNKGLPRLSIFSSEQTEDSEI